MMKGRQLLHEEGQSLWLGNITRDLMDSGTLKPDIGELSVTGPTSNPVISTRRLTIVGTGTPGAQRGCEIGTQTKRSSSRKLGETLEAISANSAWHHDCYADISGGPRYALLPALAACS